MSEYDDDLSGLMYDWRYLRRKGRDFRERRRETARAYWLMRRHPSSAELIIYIGRDRERHDHHCY